MHVREKIQFAFTFVFICTCTFACSHPHKCKFHANFARIPLILLFHTSLLFNCHLPRPPLCLQTGSLSDPAADTFATYWACPSLPHTLEEAIHIAEDVMVGGDCLVGQVPRPPRKKKWPTWISGCQVGHKCTTGKDGAAPRGCNSKLKCPTSVPSA